MEASQSHSTQVYARQEATCYNQRCAPMCLQVEYVHRRPSEWSSHYSHRRSRTCSYYFAGMSAAVAPGSSMVWQTRRAPADPSVQQKCCRPHGRCEVAVLQQHALPSSCWFLFLLDRPLLMCLRSQQGCRRRLSFLIRSVSSCWLLAFKDLE